MDKPDEIEHLQYELEIIRYKSKRSGLSSKEIKKELQSKVKEMNMRIDIEKTLDEREI